MESRTIAIKDLVLDDNVNVRIDLDEATVLRYMDSLAALPPVTVFKTPEGMILADGFHRTEAHLRAGETHIRANLSKGTRNDAARAGALANFRHGLPLVDEETKIALWRLSRPPISMGAEEISKETGIQVRQVYHWLARARHEFEGSQMVAHDNRIGLIRKAPQELQDTLATLAVEEKWDRDTLKAVVEEVNALPTVSDILPDAAPHLRAMRERVQYGRRFREALDTLRHLGMIGITPLRLINSVDRAEELRVWQEQLPNTVKYLEDVLSGLRAGRGLRLVLGE